MPLVQEAEGMNLIVADLEILNGSGLAKAQDQKFAVAIGNLQKTAKKYQDGPLDDLSRVMNSAE